MLRLWRRLKFELNRRRKSWLFWYHDGVRYRCIDPLAVWFEIMNHKEIDLYACERVAAAEHLPDTDRDEALADTVRLGREVFGIPEVDHKGRGLTMMEVRAVLMEYLAYMEWVKKKLGPQPKRSPRLEPESSTKSAPSPESDSSSTPTSSTPCESAPTNEEFTRG